MLNINKVVKLIKILQKSYYFKALLQHRVAAGVEHSQLLDYLQLQNIQTLVDIGANRGQFALVARKCFPNAKIMSFEPLKEPAAIFRRVFNSDPMVVLHELAIGPNDDRMTIHVSHADDSSSLLPITSLQNKLFPGTDEKEIRTIQVKPLDAVLEPKDIEQPALLKLDVQGFERQALEGCKTLITLFSYVYVECSFVELYAGQSLAHEVIAFLDDFGFVLSGVYNLCYDKRSIAIQGDFLFKRKSS
jgi:FkbM family methyltransferase